jgi:hypothetical protein
MKNVHSKKRILYFDCGSGISGDMLVASMIDLGVDPGMVTDGLDSLNIEGFEVAFSRVRKSGVPAADFDVILIDNAKLPYRGLSEVSSIIDGSGLSARVKRRAKKIFRIAARGWAAAHKTTISEVTFHERGAIDSIVDIVSASICLEEIGADKVIFSPITEGSGEISYRYGTLPVPVPAVRSIIDDADHLELVISDNQGEMVTPTGASIAAATGCKESIDNQKQIRILAEGRGAGKREGLGRGYLKACLYAEC